MHLGNKQRIYRDKYKQKVKGILNLRQALQVKSWEKLIVGAVPPKKVKLSEQFEIPSALAYYGVLSPG